MEKKIIEKKGTFSQENSKSAWSDDDIHSYVNEVTPRVKRLYVVLLFSILFMAVYMLFWDTAYDMPAACMSLKKNSTVAGETYKNAAICFVDSEYSEYMKRSIIGSRVELVFRGVYNVNGELKKFLSDDPAVPMSGDEIKKILKKNNVYNEWLWGKLGLKKDAYYFPILVKLDDKTGKYNLEVASATIDIADLKIDAIINVKDR